MFIASATGRNYCDSILAECIVLKMNKLLDTSLHLPYQPVIAQFKSIFGACQAFKSS